MTSKQPHRETKGRPKAVSNKQKRAALAAKRLERRKKSLQVRRQRNPAKVRAAYDAGFPPGAIPANLKEQAPNNSYGPPLYYADQPFDCVDCGRHEVWTASQQQWYFEVAKGSIYGRAIRCRACRHRRRQAGHATTGDGG